MNSGERVNLGPRRTSVLRALPGLQAFDRLSSRLLRGATTIVQRRRAQSSGTAGRAAGVRTQEAWRLSSVLVVRGHTNQAGDLWKLPRIWFYSDSVVHVRALADAIDRLYAARWRLVLTHSDAANPDTTFSLEPEPAAGSVLSALQADLRVVAGELARQFVLACDALQAQVQ
jgi:hypothetical protein